jgi:hypothetical protein
VRPVSWREAASIIERYERMPVAVLHCFGLFLEDRLGGAVVFSTEYAANLGVWDRYGFGGRIICLSRGACLPWTPKNSASHLIRRAMRLLPDCYEIVTATSDPRQGEMGVVYQAAGFDFAPMAAPGGRYRVRSRSSRSLRSAGMATKAAIEAAGLKPSHEHHKGRYFAFRGSPAVQRTHRAAIAHLVRAYPPPCKPARASLRDQVRNPELG